MDEAAGRTNNFFDATSQTAIKSTFLLSISTSCVLSAHLPRVVGTFGGTAIAWVSVAAVVCFALHLQVLSATAHAASLLPSPPPPCRRRVA